MGAKSIFFKICGWSSTYCTLTEEDLACNSNGHNRVDMWMALVCNAFRVIVRETILRQHNAQMHKKGITLDLDETALTYLDFLCRFETKSVQKIIPIVTSFVSTHTGMTIYLYCIVCIKQNVVTYVKSLPCPCFLHAS